MDEFEKGITKVRMIPPPVTRSWTSSRKGLRR
jgi:hypothetical protein